MDIERHDEVTRAFWLAGMRIRTHMLRILVRGMVEYSCDDREILARIVEVA